MPSYRIVPLGSRFTATLANLTNSDGLPVAELLPDIEVHQAGDANFGADAIYTPAVTLWAFLTQSLSRAKSCVSAVARVLVLRTALELPPCSANTGAYCKARAKLSETLLRQLTYQVGDHVEDQAPAAWRWQGRRVLLVDGFESSMLDTPANQAAYPQPKSQQPGLGFPMIRVVVLLTFASASLVGAACGPCAGKKTGETALLQELFERLRPGDVLVADRYYCAYWMIAALLARGAAVAFRMHSRRHYDFRRGRRLGPSDHVVAWIKPPRPAWMDQETYAAMPDTLTLREVRFRVEQPGCRSREIVVATTLTDARCQPKEAIADLYHQRWHVELDIRSIKRTLELHHIACKTPAMVRRALWVHFLAYNLVRRALAEAAQTQGLCPRQLSFAAGVQILEAFRWLLLFASQQRRQEVRTIVLVALATHEVGDRPGRCEPRRVKRRPKKYAWLNKPRAQARAELLN
jgi:putative transposase